MTFGRFIEQLDAPELAVVVVNRTASEPHQTMLEQLFTDQPVSVRERLDPTVDNDTVLLVEDGDVVARSSLSELEEAILLVNSDLFVTGTVDVDEVQVPDVVDELADTPFSLRGYPASNSEKLLLILLSRHIERLALERGNGTLRSSFQYLSRLVTESGTRSAYERLAGTAVDVHVYGQPDRAVGDLGVTVHTGSSQEYKNTWVVVFRPADGGRHAALLALERDPGHWEGFWTYREPLVNDIAERVKDEM